MAFTAKTVCDNNALKFNFHWICQHCYIHLWGGIWRRPHGEAGRLNRPHLETSTVSHSSQRSGQQWQRESAQQASKCCQKGRLEIRWLLLNNGLYASKARRGNQAPRYHRAERVGNLYRSLLLGRKYKK